MTTSREPSNMGFIDRVVGRAIGSITTVEPRVASFFENANAVSEFTSEKLPNENLRPTTLTLPTTTHGETIRGIVLPNSEIGQATRSSFQPATIIDQRTKVAGGSILAEKGSGTIEPISIKEAGHAEFSTVSLPVHKAIEQPLNINERSFFRYLQKQDANSHSGEQISHAARQASIKSHRGNFTERSLSPSKLLVRPIRVPAPDILSQGDVGSLATPSNCARIQGFATTRHVSKGAVPAPIAPTQDLEPVINISIGRIDVRAAVGSEQKSKKEPQRAAPLDLNEYLKSKARDS
jgi:hypothetical protein